MRDRIGGKKLWMSESEFIKAFVKSLKVRTLKRQKFYRIWHEFDTRYGRPDIMILEYIARTLKNRANKKFHNGREFTARCGYAMSFLSQRRWVRTEKLQSYLKCNSSSLKNVLKTLAARGLIIQRKDCIRAKPLNEILTIRRASTFEAKLKNWRSAISQAERHLWFTSDTYVLLPSTKMRKLCTIADECERRGIGLAIFEPKESYKIITKPRHSGIHKSFLIWDLNELLVDELVKNGRN